LTRYLGRHLMVKGKYVDAILSGRKTTTIRMGIVRPRYREIMIHGGGRPVAKAIITGVRYKKVSQLTLEDAVKDGFSSLDELLSELREAYGRVDPGDTVTIIEFRVEQRLEGLEQGKPYMGLEPVDVARLALRYLGDKLGPQEREILLELTRSGSIRAAALRKYGDLGKRHLVRRVLKKALKMLVSEGVLSPSGGQHI
jgi:hypothetical protein